MMDLSGLIGRVAETLNPPKKNVPANDLAAALSLMRQQWRQQENMTQEQQKNNEPAGNQGMALKSWYGTVPYRQGGTLGDIWSEEAAQKAQMLERYKQILSLVGRPE